MVSLDGSCSSWTVDYLARLVQNYRFVLWVDSVNWSVRGLCVSDMC